MRSAPLRSIVVRNGGLLFAGVCLAAGTGSIVAAASGHANALDSDVLLLGAWLVGPVVGAVLLDRRPGDRVALVLAGSGLLPLVALASAAIAAGRAPTIHALGRMWPLLVTAAVGVAVGILLTFPGDPRGSRSWLRGPGALFAILGVMTAALPRTANAGESGGAGVSPFTWMAFVLAALAAVAAVTLRVPSLRSATGVERRRQRWLLAVIGSWAILAAGVAVMGTGGSAALGSADAVIHVATVVGVAVLLVRADLPAVGFTFASVTLLATATAVLVATYVVALMSLSWTDLPNHPAAAAAVTALVAVGLLPAYAAARDRLAVSLYGAGQRPELVLALLSRSLDTAGEAEDSLRAACDAVAAAVRSPAANVVLQHDAATPPPGAVTVPLQAGGQSVGTLVVAPRRPDETFSRRERDLITTLAAPLAQVARAAGLAAALEGARRELAVQRLDERRRLRRDLHDGLGPLLAGLGLRLDALERAVPAEFRTQVGMLHETVAVSRREVRRLVDGLAPEVAVHPAGLEESLAELVQGWASATTPLGLGFRLDVEPALPPLGDDARIAAYRIVGEAITNVVRHAGATMCVVRATRTSTGGVMLEVRDNGVGLSRGAAGFGLRSMHERAAAIGGEVTTDAASGGGTVVRCTLPALTVRSAT